MKNEFEIWGEVTKIFVTNKRGLKFEVLIDTEDLTKILEVTTSICVNTWDSTPYAILCHKETKKGIKLHRFLMNPPSHLEIDHLNHIGLDNRKENLRICTRLENSRNRRCRADYRHHPILGVNANV